MASGLGALQANVAAAVVKRQRVFAAALHRRAWLIRRGFRAWR
jgi:hypothetical protein